LRNIGPPTPYGGRVVNAQEKLYFITHYLAISGPLKRLYRGSSIPELGHFVISELRDGESEVRLGFLKHKVENF
jgi:hypothetical protein